MTPPRSLFDHSASRRGLLRMAGAAALLLPWGAIADLDDAAAEPSCGVLVHEDGFASPTTGTWWASSFQGSTMRLSRTDLWSDTRLFPPTRYAIVPDPAGSGESVMRFTVPADQSSYRAELARPSGGWGRQRYALSVFVPADYVPYRFATILAQWHGYPLADGRAINPPLELNVRGAPSPAWELVVNDLRPDGTIRTTKNRIPVPFRAGEWTDWSVDITWSTPSTPGAVIVSHAGDEVLRLDGVNNYHQRWAPYFKTGIYRSTWRTGGYGAQPDLRIYHRDISVHDLAGCPSV